MSGSTDAAGIGPARRRTLAAPLALNDLLRAALRALEQFLIPWGLTRAGATRLGAMAAYGTVMGMVFPALNAAVGVFVRAGRSSDPGACRLPRTEAAGSGLPP
ncbi:MAG: hypothetical protein ACLU3I_07715 [Acutalibacteraceae bacterium]